MSIGRPKSPNGGEIFPLPHEGRAGADAAVSAAATEQDAIVKIKVKETEKWVK